MSLITSVKTIKAIVAGSFFIFIVLLILQLAYVFIAVGYHSLAADFPFLHNITGIFRYLIGLPVVLAVMFIGGYITADISDSREKIITVLHCFLVGFLTAGGMMYSAMDNSELTITGIVVTVLAIAACIAGGLYWLRNMTDSMLSTPVE